MGGEFNSSEGVGAGSLEPIDYSSTQLQKLLFVNGEAPLVHSRLSQIDLNAALAYFKRLQNDMYRLFGAEPSVSAKKYSLGSAYDTFTDDPTKVERILESFKNQFKINSVLTVMGYNWAEIFRKYFPLPTALATFDLNATQHILSGPHASKLGDVYLADIAVPAIAEALIERTSPDLLYLSNIPDFMNAEEASSLGEVIHKYSVKVVLTSEDVTGKKFWGDTYQSNHSAFADTLRKDGRYSMTIKLPTNEKTPYDINTFHIFTGNSG